MQLLARWLQKARHARLEGKSLLHVWVGKCRLAANAAAIGAAIKSATCPLAL